MKKKPVKSRTGRINDEIMREVSEIIRTELKDPRIPLISGVTKVDTTNDLSYCKIFVSMMGTDDEKKEAMEVLKNAAGFIRGRIAKTINLRNTPELKFILDESIDYSVKISKLIDEANRPGVSGDE